MTHVDDLWLAGVRAYFGGDLLEAATRLTAALAQAPAPAAVPAAAVAGAASGGGGPGRRARLLARRALFCAGCLLDLGRPAEAVPLLRRATRADPELREARVELCLALEAAGHQGGPAAAAEAAAVRAAAADAVVEGDLWTSPLQRPSCWLSNLASKAFWAPAAFPWIRRLEEAFSELRQELRALLPGGRASPGTGASGDSPASCWVPVGGDHRASGRCDGSAVLRGGWHEIVLFGLSEAAGARGRRLAPRTAALLRRLVPEAVTMAEQGAGEVVLSALEPGTRVAPHCARSNHRLTAHLGVFVPPPPSGSEGPEGGAGGGDGSPEPACGIRVGDAWRTWQEGKVLVFDDSYEHEVRNDTKSLRVVLLVRFWHPSLATEGQRTGALRRIEEDLAAAQRLQLLPPLGSGWHEPSPRLERQLRAVGAAGDRCASCGGEGAGGDLSLDEDRRRVIFVARCCGEVLE